MNSMFEYWKKAKSFLSKEVRVFNASETTPSEDLPFLYNWFWTAKLGIPRRINIVEIRKYAKSCWVQMVTNAICKQIMTTKWDVVPEDEEDKTDYEEQINKVTTLLNQPNRNGDSFWDVWIPFLRDVLEIDAGVVYKGKNVAGELVELFAYDGSKFLINLDEHGIINEDEGYFQYSFRFPKSQPNPFRKDEIIYGRLNTNTEYYPYGFSPLQSIQQEVEVMIQSTRYNKEFFKNNAIPDAIVSVPMERNQMELFKQAWKKEVAGQAHKLMFHNTEGIDVKALATSNKDMEWLEGQRWYFHCVFAAFGLSPQEVGFYENSNRATGDSQERISVKNAIKPYLKLIEDKINRDIIPELAGEDNIKFKWFPKDDAAEKIEHDQTMAKLQANVLTINEVRKKEGLGPVEWGDQPINMYMQDRFYQMGGGEFNEEDASGQRNNEQDKDDRRDEAEQQRKHSDAPLSKNIEFIEEPEAKDYADFLRLKFGKWETKIFKFLDRTLKDEIVEKDYNTINKTFGEFLQELYNAINTKGFLTGLKRVISLNLKEGVTQAEQELNIDIGVTASFENNLHFLADRQLEGFQIDGKRWHGLKGVARESQLKIGDIVQNGLAESKGLTDIKKEIKTYMTQQIGGEVSGKVTEGRAMRIARTETNRFRNAGRLQGYKDSGLKGYKRWKAVTPRGCPNCSKICDDLNGKVVPLDQPFTHDLGQWMYPPSHPNCRSVVEFVAHK